ncbi:zinc protease [Gammaproteobacteria bacterium]
MKPRAGIHMLTDFLLTRIRWGLLGIIMLLFLCNFPVPAAAAPRIQYWRMNNGTRVYFVEAHELPMVDLRVVFDAGSARDGTHPGIASLTNSLIDQGAGEWNADALAEKLASLGTRLYNDSLRDMALVGLRSLVRQNILNSAADLLAEIITYPTFPTDAYERERSHTLTALEEEKQSPATVASKAFYQAIYGDHPYAHPMLGTEASVAGLTREDIINFHRRYYVGHNAVIALVGDLDRAGAEALVTRVMGKLPAGEIPSPLLPAQELTSTVAIEPIFFPTAQTHILSGQPLIQRSDPDYFPLYLGNHILGGSGLVSRISEEIREKRGLSYSAYSELLPMRVKGPFVMGLQTRNDKAGEARQVLQQILEKFMRDGPSQDELLKAQQNITGGFALRLDSNHKVVEYLAMIGFYNHPLDYLDRFKANVEAVTVEKIRDAFQRRINPARLVTVVVGARI